MNKTEAVRMVGRLRDRYPNDGELWQISQYITTTDGPGDPDPDVCRGCGMTLTHPPRGRPRIWCKPCAATRQDRARKAPKSETPGDRS